MFKHNFTKTIPYFLLSLIIVSVVFFYLINEVFEDQDKKGNIIKYKYSTLIKTIEQKYTHYDQVKKYNDFAEFESTLKYFVDIERDSLKNAIEKLLKLRLDNINRTYLFDLDNNKNIISSNYELKRYGRTELIIFHNDLGDIDQLKNLINSKYKKFFNQMYNSKYEYLKTLNYKIENFEYYSEENLIKFKRWNEFTKLYEKREILEGFLEEMGKLDNLYKFIIFSEPEIINQTQLKIEYRSFVVLRLIIILFLSYFLGKIFYALKIRYFK